MHSRHPYIAGMSAPPTLTADDLLRLNLQDKRTELVRGALVVREPAGYRHGQVAAEMARVLATHVKTNGLGAVFAAETGFTLFQDPDTVRAADVAFVGRARLPDPPPRGFAILAPDLVVEVLSPDDRPGEIATKVADWLLAGSRLVWIVDPVGRRARVYRADGTDATLGEHDALDGETVLPGLRIPLVTIL